MSSKYLFKDVVLPKGGFLRGPFGGDLKKEIFVEKNVDTYKVYEQGVVLNSNKSIGRYYISEKDYKAKLHKFSVQHRDFLVSCSGVNMGAIYQLKEPFERGIINQALLRIRLNQEVIDDNYFLYLFKELISRKITSGSGDSTIPNFPGLDVIKNISFELPQKEIQIKIGQILSTLDSKIELNNRINAELEAMAKTLYDYWFVQFDFPDTNGKPYKTSGGKMVWNEELKREIPEGWEVNKIENFCRIFTGKKDVNQALDTGKYKFYSCSPNYKFSNDKLYEGKAILISGNGSYTGRTIFVDEGFDLYQRTYACVNISETDILPYLYFSILRFLSLKIGGGTHGSAIPYIVYDDIAKDTFAYNFEVVSKFQEIINPILSNIKSTDIQTIKLTELRDWLLPMLMNGQVKVMGERETELSMAAEPNENYKTTKK